METRLAGGVINRWIFFDPVKGNHSHLLFFCKRGRSRFFDSLRKQPAMFHVSVPAQQIDSDDEKKRRFLLQNLLSLTTNTMNELGPRWMKIATPLVTARVGQLAHKDISICLVFSRSITRAPETRFSQDLVATRLPQLDVASFRLHLLSLLNVTTSINGPFLFPIDGRAKLGLIKDNGKEPYLSRKQAWFLPPNVPKCK